MWAWNLTRRDDHYRHGAFSAGLKAHGYQVRVDDPSGFGPDDVLLIWNRYSVWDSIATRFAAAGGTVLVVENGYLGPKGISPHSMSPREWYAIGRGFHNDSAAVRSGGPERFAALGVELKPWRQVNGGHILLCPNRCFGTPGRIMGPEWPTKMTRELRAVTGREVRFRPHPGNEAPRVPLAADLKNCYAMVIWNSSVGIQAMIEGIPVYSFAPNWICKPAAIDTPMADIEAIPLGPIQEQMRLTALAHMAWGQWHFDEVASGTAFSWVLGS